MNPQAQALIDNVLALVQQLKAMEGGEAMLTKALTPAETPEQKAEREKTELSQKTMAAKAAEYDKTMEALKALTTTPSKGVNVKDPVGDSFEKVSSEPMEAIKNVAKSVSDVCEIVKAMKAEFKTELDSSRKETETVAKALNGVLKAIGLDKVMEAPAAEVRKGKNGEANPDGASSVVKVIKALSDAGVLNVEEKADGTEGVVTKSRTSDAALVAMTTGRLIKAA